MQCHSFFYLKIERTLDATDSDLIYTDQRLHFTEHSHGIKNNKLKYVRHFNIRNRTEDELYMFIKVHFT